MPEEQNENIKLVPMYAARVADLRAGTFVSVICDACGHSAHVAAEAIQDRLPGFEPIKYLDAKLRCDACGERGNVVVDCRRALGYA
jgi:hypothetical protein